MEKTTNFFPRNNSHVSSDDSSMTTIFLNRFPSVVNMFQFSRRPSQYGSISSFGSLIDHSRHDADDSYGSISSTNSPTNKLGLFETTNNLISLITGSGMLALPYAARMMGWSAVILLVCVACIFLYAFYLIGETMECCILSDNIRRGNPERAVRRLVNLGYDETDDGGQDELNLHNEFINNLNYVSLAELSLGAHGAALVMTSLSAELFLALVSFFINIGLNFRIVFPNMNVSDGIVFAAIVTTLLAFLDLKYAAYTSALGSCLTSLLLVALLVAGMHLPSTPFTIDPFGQSPSTLVTTPDVSSVTTVAVVRSYSLFVPCHIPFSLGLIAFCFGGIGAFPKMYTSMARRDQHAHALIYAGIVVLFIYGLIMYTDIPISLNIGRDFFGHEATNGVFLRSLAAIGIVFNIQVTCPLLTFPIRDILAAIITSLYPVSNAANTSINDGFDVGLDVSPLDEQIATKTTENLKTIRPTPSSFITIVCTVLTIALVMAFALLLRNNFANIISIIGSVVTMVNSLLLPLTFFHILTNRRTSPVRLAAHTAIALLALVTAFVGAGGNLCSIFTSKSGICAYLALH